MERKSQDEMIAVTVGVVFVGIILLIGILNTISQGTTQERGTATRANNAEQVVSQAEFLIKDVVVGSVQQAVAGSIVTTHYIGTFEDGTVFDSSLQRGVPFSFTLGAGQVIAGWDIGIAGMKVGGKRELIIPANLAYGNSQIGVIPPNSTLYFEVELIGVKRGSQ